MAAQRNPETAHRLAFAHYLRTGQRLTNEEWFARHERKFNPYHDERGRFTSPPGVTVSWGKYGPADESGERTWRGAGAIRPTASNSRSKPRTVRGSNDGPAASAVKPRHRTTDFQSDFVRNATTDSGHAETYFELNRRQAGLDRLRAAAGPRPAAPIKADLQKFQKRLDADRARLDARQAEINAQTTELLRAGAAPFDIAAGAIKVVTGDGQVRDYLSVAGAVPAGAIIHRVGGIVQIGGAQSVVKRLIRAEKIPGLEIHHVPSNDSLQQAGIIIPPSRTPVVAQLIEDHRATRSWGSWGESKEFRLEVAERLARGDVEGALRMEFDDIAQIRDGAYGHGTEDVARFIHDDLKKFRR